MKLKLLTLLLTIGLFAFGTNVNAAEQKGYYCSDTGDENMGKAAKAITAFCGAINVDGVSKTFKDACDDFCTQAKALPGKVPSKESVQKCSKALDTSKSQIATVAANAFTLAVCGGLCSANFTCDTCKWPNTQNLCGTYCCNFPNGETALGGCLTKHNKTCGAYK